MNAKMDGKEENVGLNLRHILAPIDFSDSSRQGLRQAVAVAKQFNAALTVVHVVPITLPAEWSHLGIVLEQKRLLTEARTYIERFCEPELPPGISAQTVVMEGDPGHRIVQTAAEGRADLIVICTHGYSGFKHLWLGSTAERVVRHAPCPVLTLRDKPLPVSASGEWTFQRIVVPVDFSDESRKALQYAMALAAFGNAEVVLLHAVEPPAYPRFGYAHVPATEAKLAAVAKDNLESLRTEVEGQGVRCRSLVRLGPAHDEIEDYVATDSTDLVVVGSHGRTGIPRAIFGSRAERIVRHTPVPVLVIRKTERDFVAT